MTSTGLRALLRRPVTVGLLVLVVAACVLAGVQVRAAQAAEQRADEAAALAQQQGRARSQQDHEAVLAEVTTVLAAADQEAATAAELLTATDARVGDDAVRTALGTALAAVQAEAEAARAALDSPVGAAVGPGDLEAAVAVLVTAREAVAAAHAAWVVAEEQRVADQAQAEAAAAAEAAEAERAASGHPSGLGGPPSTGAGPDCGSAASYEPPKNDGRPTFYTSTPATSGDGSNGRVPRSAMAPLGWCTDSQGNQQWLRADAAAALTGLNAEFRAEFGENIAVDLSYRSYEDQVEMREWYGTVAARPGTSNHGWGTAIDVWEWAAYSFGSDRYDWLVANAPRHGWVAPGWARADGSNPEYWHFEYTG